MSSTTFVLLYNICLSYSHHLSTTTGKFKMTGGEHNPKKYESNKTRTLGITEQNWCRAMSGGTGTTVLALQMARPPSEASVLDQVLEKLRQSHPLLRRKLHYNPTTKEFSFLTTTAATQKIAVHLHDLPTTSKLLHNLSTEQNSNNLSQCHLLLEHELNSKIWQNPNSFPIDGIDLIFANVYALSETKSVVVIRLHIAICDRTTAESLLNELMEMVVEAEGGKKITGIKNDGEGEAAIEGLVPSGMRKKTLWAHGMDMLGYSMNSLRYTNLKFKNTKKQRYSEVVRLQMNTRQTAGLLAVSGCFSCIFGV